MPNITNRPPTTGIYQGRRRLKAFEQIGSGGCQTACLANIDRCYSPRCNTTPQSVDLELARQPDETLPPIEKLRWLFGRKLRCEVIYIDHTGFDEYLDGVITYETLMQNIANVEFDGSLEDAYDEWGSQDVREWWDMQKSERKPVREYVAPYEKTGQLTTDKRDANYNDLRQAMDNGKLVLATLGDTAIMHQILCVPGMNEQVFDMYYPGQGKNAYIAEGLGPHDPLATQISYASGLELISPFTAM